VPEEEPEVVHEPVSSPGTATAPGVDAKPAPKPLYDSSTGQLNVKKVGVLVGGIAGVIATLAATSAKVESGVKWWLELDALETRATACEARLEALEEVPRRDANVRLDEALPRITHELRDGRKERQTHEQAITRLSTIHEFGLTNSREREAAQAARSSIQWRRESMGDDAAEEEDTLSSLEGL
jgi:hypothetical protein